MSSIVPFDPAVRDWRTVVAYLWHPPTMRAQRSLQRASMVFCVVLGSALLNGRSAIDWQSLGAAVAMALGATVIGRINDA